jgi:hypothetical protein
MSERRRSFWGWGWADGFPDDAARRLVAEQVGGLFGLKNLALQPPPSLDRIRMPEPRVAVPAALASFASAERLERASHTYGKGFVDIARGFRGDFSPAPDFVARPRSEAEIVAVLEWTFIGPCRPGGELEQWAEVKRAASEALSARGATITHHHAVGRVHRPWYDRERPAPFADMLRAAKRAVDPAGILNPGVLIDP